MGNRTPGGAKKGPDRADPHSAARPRRHARPIPLDRHAGDGKEAVASKKGSRGLRVLKGRNVLVCRLLVEEVGDVSLVDPQVLERVDALEGFDSALARRMPLKSPRKCLRGNQRRTASRHLARIGVEAHSRYVSPTSRRPISRYTVSDDSTSSSGTARPFRAASGCSPQHKPE